MKETTRLALAVAVATLIAAWPADRAVASTTDAVDARAVVGPPRGRVLSGAELDAASDDVAAVLRCPVCQGLSVADSPTDLARNMKQQARELLAAGYQREQVLAYFESSYGEFVRLQPPLRGVNWLVWVAPVAGLLGGVFVIARTLRRPPSKPDPAPANVADDGLEPYLRRVRELAYGWPGGDPPQPPAPAKERS